MFKVNANKVVQAVAYEKFTESEDVEFRFGSNDTLMDKGLVNLDLFINGSYVIPVTSFSFEDIAEVLNISRYDPRNKHVLVVEGFLLFCSKKEYLELDYDNINEILDSVEERI